MAAKSFKDPIWPPNHLLIQYGHLIISGIILSTKSPKMVAELFESIKFSSSNQNYFNVEKTINIFNTHKIKNWDFTKNLLIRLIFYFGP